MGLGGLLKKVFGGDGGGGSTAGEIVEYQGFSIEPAPVRHGGQYLTAGRITKAHPDGERVHEFVRADTHSSLHRGSAARSPRPSRSSTSWVTGFSNNARDRSGRSVSSAPVNA
ncbi:MAG: HlyU family transcriptional regulator [Geminicoccaceae bacterium]